MLRILVRRSTDVSYLVDDHALELDGLREGPAQWSLRDDGANRERDDVHSVLRSSERSNVVGYDLIFAAPRPISVLLALDHAHAPTVVDAHRRAVREAVDYIEQRALSVRDRRGGEDREVPAQWSQVVGFTHGVNRHGDPHLHDHVLVGARPEGSRNVLDSRSLFAHVATADALYRSSLRARIARDTPHAPWRSFEGVEHVAGLDEGYRVLWGGHHADRGEKRHWSRDEVLDSWGQDLERFESHGALVVPARARDHLDEHAFRSAFEGRHDVARRHVVQAWANAATFGQTSASVATSVDLLYPTLRQSRGVRETTINLREARMMTETIHRGPRPLDAREILEWRQMPRDRSREGWGRSR
jgi:hypothetical protein